MTIDCTMNIWSYLCLDEPDAIAVAVAVAVAVEVEATADGIQEDGPPLHISWFDVGDFFRRS